MNGVTSLKSSGPRIWSVFFQEKRKEGRFMVLCFECLRLAKIARSIRHERSSLENFIRATHDRILWSYLLKTPADPFRYFLFPKAYVDMSDGLCFGRLPTTEMRETQITWTAPLQRDSTRIHVSAILTYLFFFSPKPCPLQETICFLSKFVTQT